MRLVVVGLSSFVRRRLLPAVGQQTRFDRVDLVSRSASVRNASVVVPRFGALFRSLADALTESTSDVVYVSHQNHLHEPLALEAISSGCHVIVDKPATMTLAGARRLVTAAARQGAVVAEATIYSFHPAFDAAMEVFRRSGHTAPHTAIATFTPPIDTTDFRRSPTEGGGATLDLGAYASSLGRVLWGVAPGSVRTVGRSEGDVTTAFGVLASYGAEERLLTGTFGFDAEYSNELTLLGPGLSVSLARAFSLPPDVEAEIRIRRSNVASVETVPPTDSMRRFLTFVLDAIDSSSDEPARRLLEDARVLARIRSGIDEGRDT